MSSLEISVDPGEKGFDPARLDKITSHFEHYVADGRLSGWLVTVSRNGELVWTGKSGYRDRERGLEVTDDTIWRIFSMTKPIVSIAAMMLYEEGLFDLNDDVGRWIEEMREPRVFVGGTAQSPETVPADRPVSVQHLMTHTSGLTYEFHHSSPVDEIYRNKGYEVGRYKDVDLTQAVRDWCSSPLLFQPGTRFNYSVATDVLGRLVEIWSGQPLDVFLKERLLEPLGMYDTEFWCPPEKSERLAMLYVHYGGETFAWERATAYATQQPKLLLGGSGLVSTAHDYERFMHMLVRGGELDGVRLLSSRTLEMMTKNQLPGGVDLEGFAVDSYAESEFAGIGFGLGFSVVIDQAKNQSLISEGSFAWGGAGSTTFWVDPVEDLTVGFFTQLLPSGTYPIRRDLRQLVYQALID